MQLSGLKSSKGICQGLSIYNLKPNHKNMNLFKMFMKLCSHLVCSTFLPSVAFILLHCVGFFHCQFLVRGFLGFPHGESNGTLLQYSCLENPMDGRAWQAVVHGVAQSWTRLSDFTFTFHFSLSCIGEGNGNPLQCSCLENPRDGGAWWAAVYGVAWSRTGLK